MITLIPNNSTSPRHLEFREYQSTFKSEILNIIRYTRNSNTKVEPWVWAVSHSKLSSGYHNIRNIQLGIEGKILNFDISML